MLILFFGLLGRNLEALRRHSDPSRVHSPGTVPNQTAGGHIQWQSIQIYRTDQYEHW